MGTIAVRQIVVGISLAALLLSSIAAYGSHGGVKTSTEGIVHIEPPARVRRAGGRVLRTFEEGSTVVAGSGCLACHLIGKQGKARPGSPLTHIASRLSKRKIEHAILDPYAPMPSFRHMPKGKFDKMIKMLELLR